MLPAEICAPKSVPRALTTSIRPLRTIVESAVPLYTGPYVIYTGPYVIRRCRLYSRQIPRDEARRIAANVAKLLRLLGRNGARAK